MYGSACSSNRSRASALAEAAAWSGSSAVSEVITGNPSSATAAAPGRSNNIVRATPASLNFVSPTILITDADLEIFQAGVRSLRRQRAGRDGCPVARAHRRRPALRDALPARLEVAHQPGARAVGAGRLPVSPARPAALPRQRPDGRGSAAGRAGET